MAYKGSIEDRLAIRELIECYSDAVAQRDPKAWGATWTEDAVWDVMGNRVEGRAAIVAAWIGAMETFDFVAFYAIPGAIEVNGETATARVYVSEVLVAKEGGRRRVDGAYEDTLHKVDGAWRFSQRIYRMLHDDSED